MVRARWRRLMGEKRIVGGERRSVVRRRIHHRHRGIRRGRRQHTRGRVRLVVVGYHDGRRHGLGDDAVIPIFDGKDDLEAHLLGVMSAVASNSHGAIDLQASDTTGVGARLPFFDFFGVEDDDSPILVFPPHLFLLGLLDLLPASSLTLARDAPLADADLTTVCRLVLLRLGVGWWSFDRGVGRGSGSLKSSLLVVLVLHSRSTHQLDVQLQHVGRPLGWGLGEELRFRNAMGGKMQSLDGRWGAQEGHFDGDLCLDAGLGRRFVDDQLALERETAVRRLPEEGCVVHHVGVVRRHHSVRVV